MPVRPATASELSRIKKALSIGGSEILILTAPRRNHPRIYVTEPDDMDEAGNDVIDDVCCDIRKLFEPNSANNNSYGPKSDNFTETKTTLIFPGYDDEHHKTGVESKIKETQIDHISDINNGARSDKNTCGQQQDQVSNIEENIMNSDTEEEDGDDTDEGGFQGDRFTLSPRFDTILQLQEKVRQKRLRITYGNSVDFKRPETAPDTLNYSQKPNNTLQASSTAETTQISTKEKRV